MDGQTMLKEEGCGSCYADVIYLFGCTYVKTTQCKLCSKCNKNAVNILAWLSKQSGVFSQRGERKLTTASRCYRMLMMP